jgi:hypothetical protein
MTNTLKSVPLNLTEAKFILNELGIKLFSLDLVERAKGLNKDEQEAKFKAENLKRKIEIMFEDELKNE